jgi:hypothetical protein
MARWAVPDAKTGYWRQDYAPFHIGQARLNQWSYRVRRVIGYRSPWCLHLGEVAYESAWPRPGGSLLEPLDVLEGMSNLIGNIALLRCFLHDATDSRCTWNSRLSSNRNYVPWLIT